MEQFFKTHPVTQELGTRIDLSKERHLPEALVHAFHGKSESVLGNGLFLLADPGRYRYMFSLWGLDPADCTALLRSAFGHLVFFHQDQYKILHPVLNYTDVMGDREDLDFVFDILLCDQQGLDASFLADIYAACYAKLGIPGPDECYAFVPAVGLGGAIDADNVQRLPMQVQMELLAQM